MYPRRAFSMVNSLIERWEGCLQLYPSSLMRKERSVAGAEESLDERAMIARLEEENGEMLREMELLEQQQELENTDDQLSGLREKKAQLEEKMHVMQQTRRQLMQQLEVLMSQLNAKGMVNGGSMGTLPESLTGIGSRVTNAFRDHSMPRAGSLPAAQLQGDLLHAADDITTHMGTLLKELDQVCVEWRRISWKLLVNGEARDSVTSEQHCDGSVLQYCRTTRDVGNECLVPSWQIRL
ncbi:unnamed protein product [Anisakis simplex]|uniref:Putative dystrobrevin (inferred by orthology to a S. mansoni protein) n=1 Tax=Anisakis simplex TaxID=6269 RepID=A0A0M3KC01_ANISI|nr:unnamed protein product [Anisakis simplex]